MFSNVVYILCALMSSLCAVLLIKGYRRSRTQLLLWSAVCFVGLALNNVLLVVDLRLVPWIDLSLWRLVPAMVGAGALLYSFIWEAR